MGAVDLVSRQVSTMKLQSKKQLSNAVVEIQSGKVRGTTGQDYHGGKFYKFMGIPYAKSPTGRLRFKVMFASNLL